MTDPGSLPDAELERLYRSFEPPPVVRFDDVDPARDERLATPLDAPLLNPLTRQPTRVELTTALLVALIVAVLFALVVARYVL